MGGSLTSLTCVTSRGTQPGVVMGQWSSTSSQAPHRWEDLCPQVCPSPGWEALTYLCPSTQHLVHPPVA